METPKADGLAGVMEGVKKELESNPGERTIKCPSKECGHLNPKNRLTCEKCETRLFVHHKSSEDRVTAKKMKKVVAKREKAKKGPEKTKVKKEGTKAEGKKEEEYPKKGTVREKVLKTIRRHPQGISMGGIQKELKIVYRIDSYTQEMEQRKLIKSKTDGRERLYVPIAA